MLTVTSDLVKQYVELLSKIYGEHLKTVILYGSYARGDFNKSSDIDIMILTDLTDDEMLKYRNDIYNFAYDIECENNFNISISPIIKNIDKFNYWLEALPFYINVNKEGVVLSES